MNWPATTRIHDQKNAGPPRPMPTPVPNDPVETLMKLKAIARIRQEPQGSLQLGLDAQRTQVCVVASGDVRNRARTAPRLPPSSAATPRGWAAERGVDLFRGRGARCSGPSP